MKYPYPVIIKLLHTFKGSEGRSEKLGPKIHYKPQRTTKDKSVLGVGLMLEEDKYVDMYSCSS